MSKRFAIWLLSWLDPGRHERGLIRFESAGRIAIAPHGYRFNDDGTLRKAYKQPPHSARD